MTTKIATLTNSLAGLLLFAMGVVYLLKTSFMPYHAAAISQDWSNLEPSIQFLLLALMRAVSGGYIAVAFTTICLQWKFNHSKITWLPLFIFIPGVIVSITSLHATLIVRNHSPGQPPTWLAILGLLLLCIGYICNRRLVKKATH